METGLNGLNEVEIPGRRSSRLDDEVRARAAIARTGILVIAQAFRTGWSLEDIARACILTRGSWQQIAASLVRRTSVSERPANNADRMMRA